MSGRLKEELRCDCGNLMARLLNDEIEMKCRRCKRKVKMSIRGSDREDEVLLKALGCGCDSM